MGEHQLHEEKSLSTQSDEEIYQFSKEELIETIKVLTAEIARNQWRQQNLIKAAITRHHQGIREKKDINKRLTINHQRLS